MIIYCGKIGCGSAADVPAGKRATAQRAAAYFLLRAAMADFGAAGAVGFLENGKPFLRGEGAFISLSHTKTHALAAVSRCPVGVDIEKMRPVREALMRRLLTARELSACLSGETDFMTLWTLRESAYKALGIPLAGMEFEIAGNTAELAGHPEARFRLLRGIEGCAAAVCWAGPEEEIKLKKNA